MYRVSLLMVALLTGCDVHALADAATAGPWVLAELYTLRVDGTGAIVTDETRTGCGRLEMVDSTPEDASIGERMGWGILETPRQLAVDGGFVWVCWDDAFQWKIDDVDDMEVTDDVFYLGVSDVMIPSWSDSELVWRWEGAEGVDQLVYSLTQQWTWVRE